MSEFQNFNILKSTKMCQTHDLLFQKKNLIMRFFNIDILTFDK